MILNRIKNLMPAPKDAQGLYLVVSPEKLLLSESGSFKGSDGQIAVEVWKRKGDDDPTQENMGEYSVYIFKNGSTVASALKKNTPSFTYAASKNDATIDVKLKVKDSFVDTKTVTVTSDGKIGGNTATVFLFKRSSSPISAVDWSDTLTYTFATQQLNSVPAGWTLNKIPSGTAPVYVTAATAYSTGAADTIAANEWATPVLFVENGGPGEPGLNSAPVFLFKRNASRPDKPTATLTYTFATGKLSGSLAGWSQNIPATDGNPCWVIQATAVGTGDTDAIAASEWSEQQEYVRDGNDGSPGGPGPEGNGITDHKTFYLATTMATGVTRNTDASSWTQTYQQATPDKPYVWRYEVTYYRDTSPSYTDCELVFSYSAGANHNLLEQTNFSSIQAMNKWDIQSSYAQPYISGYKVWDESTQYYLSTSSTSLYGGSWSDARPSDVPSGRFLWTRKKLIYGKVNSSGNFVDANGNTVASGGTPATQTVYQTPDSGIGIGVDGHGVISTGTQAHNAYKDGTRLTSGTMDYKDVLRQVLNSADGVTRKLEPSTWYTLSFWAKGDGCQTFIYPSCFDNTSVCYIDGVIKNAYWLRSDAFIPWTFSDKWVRHTFTFKTKSSIGTEEQSLLFRLSPKTSAYVSNDVELCMPKLEVGMQATGYLSNEGSIHNGQLRIRRWAMNTEYMAGALDEPYDDTVAKGEAGLYHCIKAHISTKDNEPGLGASWSKYWETGTKTGFLATDIFLAKKAVIKNLISELIMTGYEGMPHIEAQGSDFKIFGNGKYPIVELAINDSGKGVLRFQNEETGALYYDLGPDGIVKTLAQDENITSSDKYQVVGLTDNSDVWLEDAFSYFDNIFNSTKAANNVTLLYTYEAKIVANLFDHGQYCATADDARTANRLIFLACAETADSGKKYIRDIAPFTGLVCYSKNGEANGGLKEYGSSNALLGHYVAEEEAVPGDYDKDMQAGLECNFMTDYNGYYVDPVCRRQVFHILEGKWSGAKTLYYNKSKVKS